MLRMTRWYVIVREPDKKILVDGFKEGIEPVGGIKDFIRKHYNSHIILRSILGRKSRCKRST